MLSPLPYHKPEKWGIFFLRPLIRCRSFEKAFSPRKKIGKILQLREEVHTFSPPFSAGFYAKKNAKNSVDLKRATTIYSA